jgi:hypothetical protein
MLDRRQYSLEIKKSFAERHGLISPDFLSMAQIAEFDFWQIAQIQRLKDSGYIGKNKLTASQWLSLNEQQIARIRHWHGLTDSISKKIISIDEILDLTMDAHETLEQTKARKKRICDDFQEMQALIHSVFELYPGFATISHQKFLPCMTP